VEYIKKKMFFIVALLVQASIFVNNLHLFCVILGNDTDLLFKVSF